MRAPLCLSSILCFFGSVTSISTLPPTEPPLIPGRPFVAIWNAPIDRCRRFHIPLDTAAFQVVTTPKLHPGQFLTLFYEKTLGLYPRVDIIRNKTLNGGIPQKGNLSAHLVKAKSQISIYIPHDSSPGLAVIDWESWRPLWVWNWASKSIYQRLSIAQAKTMAPYLSRKKLRKFAKSLFQSAGRRFMESTLSLAVRESPNRRWGFYLFPDCYNYNWKKDDYTGKCSRKTQKQNNQLLWLWERSTALFPSIYLHLTLRNSHKATLFVRNRVQEAVRVSELPKQPSTVSIYVYSRPMYRDQTLKFLSKRDLVSTIGESAALGAAGVIMWGATKDYSSEATCQSLSKHLESTLNPYLANVTAAALLCSGILCQGKGRCVRKNYDSAHYLHLNPAHFIILKADRKYVAIGRTAATDLEMWAENFTCQCYEGARCSAKLLHLTEVMWIWV